jgi:hypothetical protein
MEWSSDGDYSVYTGTVVANSSAKIASRIYRANPRGDRDQANSPIPAEVNSISLDAIFALPRFYRYITRRTLIWYNISSSFFLSYFLKPIVLERITFI